MPINKVEQSTCAAETSIIRIYAFNRSVIVLA